MNLPEITKKLRALADELDASNAHEQLKPFTLPTPPPGMQWHREDHWTAEMLPPGTRPLVLGEERQSEDLIFGSFDDSKGEIWKVYGDQDEYSDNPVKKNSIYTRTTRPLFFQHEGHQWTWHRAGDPMPCDEQSLLDFLMVGEGNRVPLKAANAAYARDLRWDWQGLAGDLIGWRYANAEKPDPYAELKAAHAEGKVIQFEQHFLGSRYWYAIDDPQWDEEPRRYRIKPDESPPWIKWHGGECPVAAETVVDVQYRDGSELLNVPALRLIAEKSRDASVAFWDHADMANDIIAYRVRKTEAPALKQKLVPGDVPPGSVFRLKERAEWFMPVSVCSDGVNFIGDVSASQQFCSWETLAKYHEINRPKHRDENGNPTLWEACKK